MDITTIGERIKTYRKENRLTQEELGAKIGVSAQAVSKWECGSVPDTELIPRIADCFGVSIDSLFGREYTNMDVYHIMSKHILENVAPENSEDGVKDAVARAFANCYLSFLSVHSLNKDGSGGDPEEWTKELVDESLNHKHVYSESISNRMIAFVDKSEDSPFFLFLPGAEGRAKKLLADTDYVSFFADLSDPDMLRAMVYLSNRARNTNFTAKLLVDGLGISGERAEEVLALLKKYHLVGVGQVEIDDAVIDTYHYYDNTYLFMVLHAAYYALHPPKAFYCSYSDRLDYRFPLKTD